MTFLICTKNLIFYFKEKLTTVFKLSGKVAALKAKLKLRRRRVNMLNMQHSVAGIIEETEVEHLFCHLGHDHLLQLSKEFEHYFPIEKDPKNCE